MTTLRAQCPGCGGDLPFTQATSLVAVCPSCRSVVARTDRTLESLGKVADLHDTASPLAVGLAGTYAGKSFHLTGRAQLRHAQGGVWDEWYAAFSDGRWGWIAEAQGRFYLTFARKEVPKLPRFEELKPEHPAIRLGDGSELVVAETGEAAYAAAEGEIPFRLVPGATYRYADLYGPNRIFATLDYSEPAGLFFAGWEVTLEELGLGDAAARTTERRVASAKVSCPQCGGALELRAPDRTERVGCPYCGSLLDANEGNLRFLKSLGKSRWSPVLRLGSSAEFDGVSQTVIGFLVRSTEIDHITYYWREYLLYSLKLGFRWLVESDHHWTYVSPVPPSHVRSEWNYAEWNGKSLKTFQRATAEVEYVTGEFYWKVEKGEKVRAVDYVRPPEMLSSEATGGEKSSEISWSHAVYVPWQEIARKFALPNMPRPQGVGPCQPFLHRDIYPWWGLFVAAAVVLFVVLRMSSPEKILMQENVKFPAMTGATTPSVVFSGPVQTSGGKNLQVLVHANVNNTWFFVDGDLVEEKSQRVQHFELPVEYYHGVDDGESWSEGSQENDTFLSAPPAGSYVVRMEGSWQTWSAPMTVSVTIREGVARWSYFVVLLLALSVIPGLVLLWERSFERSRWSESMYNPYASDDDE